MPRPPEGMSPTSSSPWTTLAEKQWRQARPMMVKRLEEVGQLSRALRMAADATAEQMFEMTNRGVEPTAARSEAMSEFLFLPDEDEVPELPADLVPLAHQETTTPSVKPTISEEIT